jgi:hypothetical protein
MSIWFTTLSGYVRIIIFSIEAKAANPMNHKSFASLVNYHLIWRLASLLFFLIALEQFNFTFNTSVTNTKALASSVCIIIFCRCKAHAKRRSNSSNRLMRLSDADIIYTIPLYRYWPLSQITTVHEFIHEPETFVRSCHLLSNLACCLSGQNTQGSAGTAGRDCIAEYGGASPPAITSNMWMYDQR